MFGRFLELAISTQDILASVQFYERLGFQQLIVGDAWPHRYGVVSDGRVHLGLHERELSSPAPSFVLPQLAQAQGRLRAAGIEPQFLQLGPDSLHYLWLRDPGGHAVVLQEARSFSPMQPAQGCESACGYFLHLSLPQSDFTRAREFWERAGLVALPPQQHPYPHVPLTGDQLDLALHPRSSCDAPLLVFECSDPLATLARLREQGIASIPPDLQRPLTARGVQLQAPEGTRLLLLQR